MAILPILPRPDPRLATLCDPVGGLTPAVALLVEDLLETMYAAPGRGLAAPQVGAMLRLFVMDVAWKDGQRDPVVLWRSDVRGEADLTGFAAICAQHELDHLDGILTLDRLSPEARAELPA